MAKRPPYEIKVYESLPRNPQFPLQEFKVRVVKYQNSDMLLDIREFITSELFTGYSPKGITINEEQVRYLFSILLDVIDVMRRRTIRVERKANVKQISGEVESIKETS